MAERGDNSSACAALARADVTAASSAFGVRFVFFDEDTGVPFALGFFGAITVTAAAGVLEAAV